MMKDRKKLANLLIGLILAFVWGNSMRAGEASQDMSEGLLEWINIFLHLEEYGAAIAHHLLRKAAHFTEFACLGALIAWRCHLGGEKRIIAFPTLLGMAAALVDETIQLFAPDRGPSLMDVWLDASGVLAGVLLLYWGHHLLKKKHNP